MAKCNECLHLDVCKTADSCDGCVPRCKHFLNRADVVVRCKDCQSAKHFSNIGGQTMKTHDATEEAYKNGYEDGKRDAVKHGRWVDSKGDTVAIDADGCPLHSCTCSVCGEWLTASDEYACIGNFCPNCGARMDGASE